MAIMIEAFTRAHYDQLPEGFPAQLIDGQLVKEPSPTYGHQDIHMRLLRMLMPLVPDGLLISAPADVAIDDYNVFQPDIVVLRKPPANRDQGYVGTPRLAIEVLSPGTAAGDRGFKARKLLDAGVDEVWLVDPTDDSVELRTADAVQRAAGAHRLLSEAVRDFVVVPEVLFAAQG